MTKKKTKPKKTKSKTDKFVMNRGQVMAVMGNWGEGFQLVGPFTDFEAADAACPTAAWLWSVEPPSDPETNWANNGIQFARLIAEMDAAGILTDKSTLREVMDSTGFSLDELDHVIQRAVRVWDEIDEWNRRGGGRKRD